MIEDISKEIEIKMEKQSKYQENTTNLESDINDLLEENKVLESEIEKLGKKTT